jgi:anthranilate 1,2-dioxygenase small subunit/terephthalate 1,2-dioxygenase oxygenase component beta subunit
MLPELQFAILDLNARYAHALDENLIEQWPGFFTASARYIVTTAENFEQGLPLGMIYATSRAMLQDRVRSLREANIYEAQRYRHIVGLPLLEPAQDGGTRACTSFIVVRVMHSGETMVYATGCYRDVIATDASDGVLRFSERIVVLDSRRIDTLLALPL